MAVINVTYGEQENRSYQSVKKVDTQGSDGGPSAGEIIRAKMNEIAEKVKNGDTEQSIQTGGQAFTEKEWDKLMKKVDVSIEQVKEEQRIEKEKQEAEKKTPEQ